MRDITSKIQGYFELLGLDGKITTLLSAIAILIVGRFIAKLFKKVVYKGLNKTNWDNKLLGDKVGEMDVNEFISKFVYFIIQIFVLLLVLSSLGLDSVLDPIKNMLDEILAFLPNLLAAGLIGFVGYIIAKMVSNLIGMGSTLLEKFTDKLKIQDPTKVLAVLQKVVFAVILIPFIIQALNSLQINAISEPANAVLNTVLNQIPNVIAASVIITLFSVGGKYLVDFLGELLKSIGVEDLSKKMNLDSILGEEQSLVSLITGLVYFFLIFFGIITGVEVLELTKLNEILSQILEVTGQIMFGLLILVIGNFIASTFYKVLSKSENNQFVASIARGAIIALFVAISLTTMGIANSIVELAFGLILGAVAVAVALSYGLGGREAAGEHMREILKKFKK